MKSSTNPRKQKRIGESAGKKRPTSADHPDQATVEEFEEEGLGVAPKE